jgi:hypothetical protein
MRRRLELCARYGIRPTLLINAHQGVPCPLKSFERRLLADAPKGARTLRLDNVKDLVTGRSGVNGLSDYWAAEGLVTAINTEVRHALRRIQYGLESSPPIPLDQTKRNNG